MTTHIGSARSATHPDTIQPLKLCPGPRPTVGPSRTAAMPELWWRHPTHRVHHRAGADPEDPYASRRTARTTARLAGPWPADRLGRARAGPRRTRRDSIVARRCAGDRHPQPLTGAGRDASRPRTGDPGDGLRRGEKIAIAAGHEWRFGEPPPEAQAALPEAHRALISPKPLRRCH